MIFVPKLNGFIFLATLLLLCGFAAHDTAQAQIILPPSQSGNPPDPTGPTAPSNPTGVFASATKQAHSVVNASYQVLTGLGLLSVLGVAAMAMTGRMPWGWAFAVIAALFLVKLAVPMVSWICQIADVPNAAATCTIGSTPDDGLRDATGKVLLGASGLGEDTKGLLQIFSGIAIAALAILSVFGRFQWKWLACIIGGLALTVYAGPMSQQFTSVNQRQASVGDFLANSETLVDQTARQGQYIIYALGGLGVMGLGALAVMGRFSWSWFFAIAGGLMLVAGVSSGISYITRQNTPFEQQSPQ
jgi:hypothetical protein